jgi:hypothetical protein
MTSDTKREAPQGASAAALALRWGGGALAGIGTVAAVSTYASVSSSTTEPTFDTLRTWNAVAWAGAGVGAAAFVLSFFVQRHGDPSGGGAPATSDPAHAPSTSSTRLDVSPGGFSLRGTF